MLSKSDNLLYSGIGVTNLSIATNWVNLAVAILSFILLVWRTYSTYKSQKTKKNN